MSQINKKNPNPSSGVERRSRPRRPILTTFSIFVVIPKKGDFKLQVHDVSENGIAFDLDIEGESISSFPIEKGSQITIKFYLNQSLYIPLTTQVVRVSSGHPNRRVGAEFQNLSSPEYEAFLNLLKLLDSIVNVLQTDS